MEGARWAQFLTDNGAGSGGPEANRGGGKCDGGKNQERVARVAQMFTHGLGEEKKVGRRCAWGG